MKKLIGMTEFVLQRYEDVLETNDVMLSRIINYANFLKQPLTLGMFVPCDLDGNVLEDSCKHNSYCIDFCQGRCQEEYNEAKNRCLFDGIEYVEAKKEGHYSRLTISGLSPINYPSLWGVATIESLIPYDLEL